MTLYICEESVFLRPQSEGIVPVAERRSPAGGGYDTAGDAADLGHFLGGR